VPKINIISVGNFKKNDSYRELFREYEKRVDYKIKLIELKNHSGSNVEEQKNREGKDIIRNLSNNFKTIILDEKGEIIATNQFCEICNKYFENFGGINFVIGGSDGLSMEVVMMGDYVLSLGKMIFPHLMVRVMLMEQLYRVFTINNRHPYHK
jgi:23S rRNA (pseudouridine1915-N3)-methyltransferase